MSDTKEIATDFVLPECAEPLREHDYSAVPVEQALRHFESLQDISDRKPPEKKDPAIRRFSL